MISFKNYLLEQTLGNLIGAQSGGAGGNWGGSLPKLISLLPMGNWNASSQKRGRVHTKSGGMSDHYSGNSIAYAGDFGLNSTFKGDTNAATNFAVAVARNGGANISSWQPYVGKHLTFNTQDGYRVQIIWQYNVGGNHYDHVHVGVKRGAGTPSDIVTGDQDVAQQAGQTGQTGQPEQSGSDATAGVSDYETPGQAAAALFGAASSVFGGGQK